MSRQANFLKRIEEGPSGPQVAAFFDFDRTLIAGFSASAFAREWLRSGRADSADIAQAALSAVQFQLGGMGFSDFVTRTMVMLKGLEESQYERIAEEVYKESIATEIYPEARALVRAHQAKGHTVAVVSSATRYQIAPVARDLEIEHMMCTGIEVKDGRFTGELCHPTCYGEGKATVAREFAEAHGVDLVESYFYTDSHDDLPLLEIVGRPRPVNPNRRLASIAAKRGWPQRTFGGRGTPSAVDVVRTALAVGSIIPSFALGLPAAILDGDLRQTMNLTATTWGELGSALAGLHVSVDGEQHLWSERPAVFIFNHQSNIDSLLLCKLLRRDFVGIGKQEIRNYPVMGRVFALAGTIFIDRFDRVEAVKALEPAVEALRKGLSIAIAPEGTRSLTPRLGRFKKGAFHIAMAAGVPVIPIVFHNTLDAMPKYSLFIRPAPVQVTVLEPVRTEDWKPEDLNKHINEVRDLYLETLGY